MAKNTQYAVIAWTAEDVKAIRKKWSLKRCEEELAKIEGRASERIIELGWEVLDVILPSR